MSTQGLTVDSAMDVEDKEIQADSDISTCSNDGKEPLCPSPQMM